MNEMIAHLAGDTSFWVMVSTVLCFGFIAFKARRPIIDGLDGRAAAIQQRLAEAETLRAEAQSMLEEYKRKSVQAMTEADEIMTNAQRRVDQMRTEMEKALQESIARQELNAKNRIARMEEEAMQVIKNTLVNSVLTKVKSQAANQSLGTASIDDSMDDLKKILQK